MSVPEDRQLAARYRGMPFRKLGRAYRRKLDKISRALAAALEDKFCAEELAQSYREQLTDTNRSAH